VPEPVKVEAERMSAEDEAVARAAPVRTVRAKSADPVSAKDARRARVRAFAVGAAVATGASVAAAIGYIILGRRRAQRRNHG